jgi:hypothetical protein
MLVSIYPEAMNCFLKKKKERKRERKKERRLYSHLTYRHLPLAADRLCNRKMHLVMDWSP